MIQKLTSRVRLALLAGAVLVVSLLAGAYASPASAATDWTDMTSELVAEFDAAKVVILPVAGGILALFLGYKVIKRFT